MSSVDGIQGNALLDSMRVESGNEPVYETQKERQELTQEDFFSLLTQQLAYQDPFKPVENAEMVSQMTGFSTSEGIAELNNQMTGLNDIMASNQALQASTLVGQQVLTPGNKIYSEGGQGGIGEINVDSPTKTVTVRITDQVGQLVKSIPLGDLGNGAKTFEWDGTDTAGNPVADGAYTISASGNQDGTATSVGVSTYARVQSVSLNNAGGEAQVNLAGLGSINLSDVKEVTKG